MREQVRKLALELGVVGLMNVQFAVKDNEIYLIEVNPVPPVPCRLSPRPPVPRWPRLPPASWPVRA